MIIAHYKRTQIAFAPEELSNCINKYTKHKSYINQKINESDILVYHNKYIKYIDLYKLNVKYEKLLNKKSFILYHTFSDKTDNYNQVILMKSFFIFVIKKIIHNRFTSSSYLDKNKSKFLKHFLTHKVDCINQMVVSQYQATLKEYDGYKKVKNIIDFNKKIYNLKFKKSKNIRIGFSPSITNKSYKSEWETKGYKRTIKILDNLVKNNNSIEYDIITGVSLTECLKRKGKCDIIIDECVTSSYHRSGLEGLALGKLTICSLGDEVIEIFKEQTGSKIIPFENIWINDLEKYLQELINKGKDFICSKGKKNRIWMERYWNPKDIVQDYIKYFEYEILNKPTKILFILQYDTFVNTFIPVIKYLKEKNVQCSIILLKPWYQKNWIDSKILNKINLLDYEIIYRKNQIYNYFKNNYDVCVFGTVGQKFVLKTSKYLKDNYKKTKIVTGYIGLTLNNNSSKFTKGIKRRYLSDMIFVPGEKAFNDIVNKVDIKELKNKIKITGLPRFEKLLEIKKTNNKTNNILFIEQPDYPESKKERYDLIQNLSFYAKNNPEKTIIIKPRFDRYTGHAHKPKYLLQDIIKNCNTPENLIIQYNDLYTFFPKIDFALTVSSTAGLESLFLNIPTYFINNYCNGENTYGSEYFNDLNAVISFKHLFNNNLPQVNFDKVNQYIDFSLSTSEKFAKHLIHFK